VANVDESIQPFVGRWEAEVWTFQSVARSGFQDMLDIGWTFTAVIEPSGAYTATFTWSGPTLVEFGQLSVSGNTLIFTPTQPVASPQSSTFEFLASDRIAVEGLREWDFDLSDGEPEEPAYLYQELQRR
jgi:hypothetical protein